MTTPPAIREANRRLKAFLRTGAAYRRYVPTSTWVSGGCWLLAEALKPMLGGELVALQSDSGIEHVLVQVGNHFVDGDGFSLKSSLLRRWREKEGLQVQIVPFDESARAAAKRRGIPRPSLNMVNALSLDLVAALDGAT